MLDPSNFALNRLASAGSFLSGVPPHESESPWYVHRNHARATYVIPINNIDEVDNTVTVKIEKKGDMVANIQLVNGQKWAWPSS